jgi:hypothetical protein
MKYPNRSKAPEEGAKSPIGKKEPDLKSTIVNIPTDVPGNDREE